MRKIKREWREALVISSEAETRLAILRKKIAWTEETLFLSCSPRRIHFTVMSSEAETSLNIKRFLHSGSLRLE
jgi:hypothetical protein